MKGFLTEREVVEKLRERLGAGSQKLLAEQASISEQYLCDILKGRRRPADSVLDLLNLEAVEQLYRVKEERNAKQPQGGSRRSGKAGGMSALREVAAGRIDVATLRAEAGTRPLSYPKVGQGDGGSQSEETHPPNPPCVVCEAPLRSVKGKFACGDESCAKYGVEQKGRK